MIIKFNFNKIARNLTLNQYFLLVKIYMYMFYKYNFNYSGGEHIDNLINLKYITEDDKNRINLSEAAIKELNGSMRVEPLGNLELAVHDSKLDDLANQMIAIFPKGKKDGKWYWRSSPSIVVEKLKSFFAKYGNTYTHKQLITATERYVNNFKHNDAGMSIMKYFIEKRGNGSILLDYLEQEDDTDDDMPITNNQTNYI